MRFLAKVATIIAVISIILGIILALTGDKIGGQNAAAFLKFTIVCLLFAIVFLLEAVVSNVSKE